MTAVWIAISLALMGVAHWWPPAYALAGLAALEALVAHERGTARRARRRRERRKGGYIYGR